jgi:RNase H-fold protein (predicted Holliday junction resolvase)
MFAKQVRKIHLDKVYCADQPMDVVMDQISHIIEKKDIDSIALVYPLTSSSSKSTAKIKKIHQKIQVFDLPIL